MTNSVSVPDVMVSTDSPGSFMFTLHTDEAREWVDENVDVPDYLWFGNNGFAVFDTGLAANITGGMLRDGLLVE